MKNTKYTTNIENYRVEVSKKYRNKTQYEWFLNIFIGDSDKESIHLFKEVHLTRKSAINEAIRSITINKPKIERVY